ncbi:MAG: hypothetical protein SFX73_29380 [Kofleriaceae bacterium]|nr:hypothetical protein [Kofleriaceae bacterium]
MRTSSSTLASLLLAFATAACATDAPPSDEEIPPTMEQPTLALDAAAKARVIRGRTVTVAVKVERSNLEGDVRVVLEDLPDGVSASPVVIPAGKQTGMLHIEGGPNLALGTFATATLRATGEGLEATRPLDLHLTDPAGTLDATFGLGGIVSHGLHDARNEAAHHVALQEDGKVVIAGVDLTAQGFFVARYDAHGTLDPSFATGGVFTIPDGNASYEAIGLTIRADGTILFVVRSTSAAGIVYALTPTGTLAADYGSGGFVVLNQNTIGRAFGVGGMSPAPDGTLMLAAPKASGISILRLDPNGALDPSFDQDGIAELSYGPGAHMVRGLTVRPDGRAIVAGAYYNVDYRYAVAQVTPAGALDPEFSEDGKLVIETPQQSGFADVSLLPDGRIALPGATGSTATMMLLTRDGRLDSSFGGDGVVEPNASTVYQLTAVEGGLVATLTHPGAPDFSVLKVRLDGSVEDGFGVSGLASASMTPGAEFAFSIAVDDQDRLVTVGMAQSGAELGQIALARFWQ